MIFFHDLLHYTLLYSEDAAKSLENIDGQDAAKIVSKIRQLKSGAKNLDIKKLKGSKYHLFRLRCGNYRILYQIDQDNLTLYIVAIGVRSQIYKNLD